MNWTTEYEKGDLEASFVMSLSSPARNLYLK